MTEERRGAAARVGIAALNLLAPGAGLLRLGEGKAAALCLVAGPGALLSLLIIFAVAPELSFGALLGLLAAAGVVALAAFIASLVLSVRRSGRRSERKPLYSRWYAIAAVILLVALVDDPLVGALHGFYKPFYVPAEGMEPTLLKNDRFIASMRPPAPLRRGDVVLVRVGGAVYVKRLAALSGDRIALRGGIVYLNGVAVPQRFEREERVTGPGGAVIARRLSESFPGEAGSHEIRDLGPSPEDDFGEVTVAPGRVFVLGDNRDESADSRVPAAQGGVEQAPLADIVGRALYYSFGPSHRSGQRIH